MDSETYVKCEQAKAIVENPFFIEMSKLIEDQYIKAWKMAKTCEEREAMWHQVQALHDVFKSFRVLSENKDVWDLQEKKREEKEAKKAKIEGIVNSETPDE